MKKTLFLFLLLSLTLGCSKAPSGTLAVNPLTYTDIPDPDIVRVGDDYYMVSTTMYFCPGAPIMHSKDLVHWRIISYVYDCLEDDDIYNLRNGRHAYGKGQWAASIRYHDGLFWVLFCSNDQQKTYVYKTADIENGPWERIVLPKLFHDASMLFEDGHLYLVYGNGDLRITELSPDGSSIIGEDELLISSPREGWMLRAEGSHLYHIGDYYYVLEIDWPRGGVRTATVWRSHTLKGEYERKVVLSGTLGGRGDGIAQGPIVDTPKGDWYTLQFQDHGAVGRIPTIQKVTWVDDWPIMGVDTVPEESLTVELKPYGEDYVWGNDEFDSSTLPLVWQWNHKAPDDWSLSRKPGFLSLKAHGPVEGIATARGTLTQRTVGPRCISETLLDHSSLVEGDEAGLVAFQSGSARLGVEVSQGKHLLVLREKEEVKESIPIGQDPVYLRIRYVFTPQEDDETGPDTAFLSYSFDGEQWVELPYTLKMRYTLDYFTGYRSSLYCFSRLGEGGEALFDYFHQWTY